MSLPTIYPRAVYRDRLLVATIRDKVNEVSEQSAHLITSSLVICLVFAYMFVHPTSSTSMIPIVSMIVGHVLGTQSAKKKVDGE